MGKIGMFTVDQFVLMAWARRMIDPDVVPLSAHNEMDFGRRGMQYIHFPMLMVGRRELAKLVGQPGTCAKDLLGYACRLIFRVRNRGLVRNATVCNSRWTSDVFRRYYGSDVSPGCLYPPCTAAGVPAHAEWEKREEGVVMIGRLVAHKRLEDGIKIVQGVRDRGHNLHLHLVSSGGDEHYVRQLRKACRGMDWITWETGLSRDALLGLVQSHRYGLHCNHNEHFGMVTAEMSGSGCLVLGHDSGGTCEILPLDGQRYDTVDAGIDRLEQMHTNPELQVQMLDFNRKHSEAFGIERFRENLLAWVSAFTPE